MQNSTNIIQQQYPINTLHHKPIKNHCLIEFYKGFGTGFIEPVEIYLVEDRTILEKIMSIGYTRKDMQSLKMNEHYSYLTTDGLVDGVENHEKALVLIKSIFDDFKITFPSSFDEIFFSFPEDLFN